MYRAPTPRNREQSHAVWLPAQGWTAAAVAQALERNAHTICQWARAFAEGGPKAPVFEGSGGSPAGEDGPRNAKSSTSIVHRGNHSERISAGARVLQRTAVSRRLGVFFLVMALLMLIDWGIILFFRPSVPPLQGLTFLACPGNGFASYCAGLALFTLALAAGTLVTAVFVNLTRKRRRDGEALDSATTRRRWETNLTFYASLALTVAYAVHWVVHFFHFAAPPLGPDMLGVLTKVFNPLLIIVFVATGRHLVRSSTSNRHHSQTGPGV